VRPGAGCHVCSASSTAGGSQGAADLLGDPATDYRPRRCAAEFAGTPGAIAIRATQRCGKPRMIRIRSASPRRSVGLVERPRLSGRVDAHDRVTGGHTAAYVGIAGSAVLGSGRRPPADHRAQRRAASCLTEIGPKSAPRTNVVGKPLKSSDSRSTGAEPAIASANRGSAPPRSARPRPLLLEAIAQVTRSPLSPSTNPDNGTTTIGLRAAAVAMRDEQHRLRVQWPSALLRSMPTPPRAPRSTPGQHNVRNNRKRGASRQSVSAV
jgi:hypothetical protein